MTTEEQPQPPKQRSRLLVIAIAAVVAGIAIAAAVIALVQSNRISNLSNTNQALINQIALLTRQEQAQAQRLSAVSAAAIARANANAASLGVCESTSTETLNNYSPPVTVITDVTITSPTLTQGVASCPNGSFVPVAPQGAGTP